jgi:ABC-2 type transport system permease protein
MVSDSALPGVKMIAGNRSSNLRAVKIVWRRDLIRFARNRTRLFGSFVQPVLFLFVLGTGLSPIIARSGNVDFRTFIYPGIIAMVVFFAGTFSAISVVWDREFGFLREMLVAPVSRSSLVIGKILGGATIATIQGAALLLLAGLVHVPYDPALLVTLFAQIVLTALVFTSFGVLLASRMSQVDSFQPLTQFVVLPLFFLSGAIFPLSRLPEWLATFTRLNPLSYAVDPLRRTVFSHLDVPMSVERTLNPGLTWNGWRLPTAFELTILALFGVFMLISAAVRFSKAE